MSSVAELDREPGAVGNPPSTEAKKNASNDGMELLRSASDTSSDTSGVTARGGATRAQLPSEDQLLDVLYEVLVQGVPPRSTLTREEVEQFLHQHARRTKPVSEILAFFEQHGLPIEPQAYGADRELGELASGLQRERNSLMPGFGPAELPEPERLAASTTPQTLPPQLNQLNPSGSPGVPVSALGEAVAAAFAPQLAAALENEKTGRRAPPPAPSSRGLRWLVAIAALLAIAAGGVAFALNYQRATTLEQRLDQARMQQRSTDDALTKLEQREETLQRELKQSESVREQEAARLKDSLEEQAKRRASEEMAIERVLGPRYLKLRQKYSDQAAAAPKPSTP